MKLIVIHGENTAAASKKITDIKSQFDPLSITHLSGTTDLDRVLLETQSASLFAEDRLVILENVSDKFDLSTLQSAQGFTLVVHAPKELSPTSLLLKSAQAKGSQIIFFPEAPSANIFPFLDKVFEGNPQAFIDLEKLYSEFGGQYLLTMLIYGLRRLILPPKTKSSFALKKLEDQKKRFSGEEISHFYHQLLETDFRIKSGILEEKMGLHLLLYKYIKS